MTEMKQDVSSAWTVIQGLESPPIWNNGQAMIPQLVLSVYHVYVFVPMHYSTRTFWQKDCA